MKPIYLNPRIFEPLESKTQKATLIPVKWTFSFPNAYPPTKHPKNPNPNQKIPQKRLQEIKKIKPIYLDLRVLNLLSLGGLAVRSEGIEPQEADVQYGGEAERRGQARRIKSASASEREVKGFRGLRADRGEALWWRCCEWSSQESCHLEKWGEGGIRAQVSIYRLPLTNKFIFS